MALKGQSNQKEVQFRKILAYESGFSAWGFFLKTVKALSTHWRTYSCAYSLHSFIYPCTHFSVIPVKNYSSKLSRKSGKINKGEYICSSILQILLHSTFWFTEGNPKERFHINACGRSIEGLYVKHICTCNLFP